MNAKTMSTPKVSVVIASYNMGVHIAEAVSSVLAQTMPNLEVIVVDDGSTDDTLERLATFSSDPRVSVIASDHLGQPRAKNAGIQAAKGEFIAFCDADDYWLPRKLELQLPIFDSNPRTGVVYSHVVALHSDGSQSEINGPKYLRGDVLNELFVRNIVPFGTAVVRRECLNDVGMFDESIPMGIDWDLWLRIATQWHFDYVSETTYIYRIWGGQMSKNWEGRYNCALTIMKNFLKKYPDRVPSTIIASAYADTYTNLAAHHLRHFGIITCISTLRRALFYKPNFWPAWKLLLGVPFYKLKHYVEQ